MDKLKPGSGYLSRRIFLMNVAISFSSALLAACSDQNQSTPTTPITGDNTNKPVIALIVGVKSDPFYVTMAKGAQAMATEQNISLVVDGPTSFDTKLQIPIVDAMVKRGVGVIIIAACDKTALIEPLQRANAAGIKVISVDTFIGNGDYINGPVTFPLSYIGSDNLEGGRIAGEVLIKSIGGDGKVYIQNTAPGTSSTAQRAEGCKQAIAATQGSVTLIGEDYNYNSASKASTETLAVVEKVGDLAGIFGTNVDGAEGASQGVKIASKLGKIKIANFDAPEQSITDLRNGVVDILIAQKPGEMGSVAVEYAVNALKGNASSIQKHFSTGFVIIDKNNIDTPEAQSVIYVSR